MENTIAPAIYLAILFFLFFSFLYFVDSRCFTGSIVSFLLVFITSIENSVTNWTILLVKWDIGDVDEANLIAQITQYPGLPVNKWWNF